MMLRSTGIVGIAAVAVLSLTAFAEARQAPAAEVMPLGLRGVYFVENQGQWSDASVEYGFKTRGLDIAFRESSFTMHLSREVSRDVPVAVVVDPTDGAWASRPYEYQVVERASRPYEYQVVERVSRPYESATVPEASLKPERGFFSFDDSHPLPHGRGSSGKSVEFEHLTLTVTFPGSNPAAPRGAQPQEAKFNYYIGDDESKWASNVPSFGAIIYENLYDGVDLTIAGNDDGVLKYEFHVAPGADWNQIRIAYDGIDSLCVDESGDLRIATSFGTLMDSAPLVWQEDVDSTSLVDSTSRAREEAGSSYPSLAHRDPLLHSRGSSEPTRDTIPARFELVDATTYRFALDGSVDPARPLIIDPDVEWMRYLGGTGEEDGTGVAVAPNGDVAATGWTWSEQFEGQTNRNHGQTDAFVAVTDSAGSLRWMTFVGGSSGDSGSGVAFNAQGSITMVGDTSSPDFAEHINDLHGSSDLFLARLSSSGVIERSSYVGGSAADGTYSPPAIDAQGHVLVAGVTESNDLEGARNSLHDGPWDSFVTRIDAQMQIQWSVYLGGEGGDSVADLAVDADGCALVAGVTGSDDFEGRINAWRGSLDAFVVKIDSAGSLQWMIYLGGSADEDGNGIAVEPGGNIVVCGYTLSSDFDGAANAPLGYEDAYVAWLKPNGAVVHSVYLGGTQGDYAYDLAVDDDGNAIITGETNSSDFVGRRNEISDGLAILLSVNQLGYVNWMKYFGGSSQDWGSGVAVGSDSAIYVAGGARSDDFVGRLNRYGGGNDAFVLRFAVPEPRLVLRPSCPSGGPITVEWSGATPDGGVALLYARESGTYSVPPNRPCAGVQISLGAPRIHLVFQGLSGPDGSRTLNASAGSGACGGYLQLLDLATCSTSNVARIE